ncbi:hypothetical protein FOQG_02157 [Fusarium oxysporum f. sp. raphani 54005]|uniref:Uncharacterized protein n=3 Tax=Fusarium oxysporum TaxID=5507 RepID=X0CZM6_FUSOX|nr:hypothetical protein FOVG_07204 [Fusarium oxysporum f. sp. pisi HDV247]EXK96728.1 hypothetical protein FOQG_02157 [Fusarium oxysporum f. sp. raphani 54005]KAG7433647.1 hypothetical protein Forpi1262_v003914 [Fusarium oxysporum f. sp. raphani]KAJ4038390.1 hypothetical protein NW758_009044 [Fusarium oxysporum]WKT40504.1 hypothetical protein QSH57_005310 [Fusarium oxysporum f. sp. vasinfectum]
MPKSAPPRQGNFRSNPYGTWISPGFAGSQNTYYPSPSSRFDDPPFGMQQRAWGPPSLGSPERPYDVIIPPPELNRSQRVAPVPPPPPYSTETTEQRSKHGFLGGPPTSAAAENPGAQDFKPAQQFWSPQTQLFERQKQPLKQVDSMVLQAVTRNSRWGKEAPDLRVISNSKGGGTQCNVYSKVPSVAKTISFNVDDEEALLKAYRHVKAMNPSAPVGGIMFSIGAKGDRSQVDNISWNSFAGRSGLGRSFSMNLNGDNIQVFRPRR